MTTSTWLPTRSTLRTEPTSTPATRTGAPAFRPAAFENCVLSEYRCQKKPPSPLRRKIMDIDVTSANTVTSPTLSSAHPSERVRGIDLLPLLQEIPYIRV